MNSTQNSQAAFLIVVLIIATVVQCRKHYGKWLNPIAIIFVWWAGWLAVAEINFIGIPSPSYYLVSIIIIGLIFVLFGALTARRRNPIQQFEYSSYIQYTKIAKYIKLIIVFISGPVLWFGIQGLIKQSHLFSVSDYRGMALEGVGVYGSVIGYLFYNRIIAPLLFCCILWVQCCGNSRNKKEKLLMALVVVLVAVDSMGNLGRTTIYFMAIGLAYCWIFRNQRHNLTSYKFSKMHILGAAFVCWLIWMSQRRFAAGGMDAITLSSYFAIWYHTAGFVLFDIELNDSISRLNNSITFGQASFGGLIEYVLLMFRPIVQFDSVSHLNGIYQNEMKIIGYSDVLNAPIFSNAYYTVFYSLFQDFRWFGIIGGCFLYGRILNNSYRRYISSGNIADLYLLNALMFCGMFGIFQSPLESARFWMVIIFYIFIFKVKIKIKTSMKRMQIRQTSPDQDAITLTSD